MNPTLAYLFTLIAILFLLAAVAARRGWMRLRFMILLFCLASISSLFCSCSTGVSVGHAGASYSSGGQTVSADVGKVVIPPQSH